MDEGEFPDVVELNVGGIHFTTLLSTLRKDEESALAAMFTGALPVNKDKDGRYFLDGDGKLFPHILNYLRADILPNERLRDSSTFGFGVSSNYPNSFDQMMIALHKEAVLFGLKGLTSHLNQYQGIFIERQLDNFRTSKAGYAECLKQILEAIPMKSLLGSPRSIVVLTQEVEGQLAKCCDHLCNFSYPSSGGIFGAPQKQNSPEDMVYVKVPFEVDYMVLNCLYIDLIRFGFNINSGISECNFWCEKGSRNVFGSTGGFGNKTQRQCCREPINYMQLNWYLSGPPTVFRKPGFGFGEPQATGTESFGGQNSNTFGSGLGFNFGGGSSTVGQESKTGLFGQQQKDSSQGGFGGSQLNTFGQTGFGSQQNNPGQGSLFGSQQSNQTVFSSAKQTKPEVFKGFGFKQAQSQIPSAFGSQPVNQNSLFGSSKPTGFSVGTAHVFGKTPAPAVTNSLSFTGFGLTELSLPKGNDEDL